MQIAGKIVSYFDLNSSNLLLFSKMDANVTVETKAKKCVVDFT
jgi:hypothetical protein